MEYEHPEEPTDPQSPEAQKAPETDAISTLESLPAELGFAETDELRAHREEMLTTTDADPQAVIDQRVRYIDMGREITGRMEGLAGAQADIGLTVQMALIRRATGGSREKVLDDLYDAVNLANNLMLDDLVNRLQAVRAAIKAETWGEE